jgi:hypothetical protein
VSVVDRQTGKTGVGHALEHLVTGEGEEDGEAAAVTPLLGIANVHSEERLLLQPRPQLAENCREAAELHIRAEALCRKQLQQPPAPLPAQPRWTFSLKNCHLADRRLQQTSPFSLSLSARFPDDCHPAETRPSASSCRTNVPGGVSTEIIRTSVQFPSLALIARHH